MKQRFSKRTRLVSMLLALAMVFTFLPLNAFAASGRVYINDENFPDKNFQNYLKDNVSGGKDYLTQKQCDSVKEVKMYGDYPVERLDGIIYFQNLETLYLTNAHNLRTLDVSWNSALKDLSIGGCHNLTSLDLRYNPNLQELNCTGTGLTSLDLSRNPELEILVCAFVQMTQLDLSNNTKLTKVDCVKAGLTKLNVKQCNLLKELDCSQNNLTELDAPDTSWLRKLNCSDNPLNTLNVSGSKYLTRLDVSGTNLTALKLNDYPWLESLQVRENNQLTQLELKNLPKLEYLYCDGDQLTQLELSDLPALKRLDCDKNQLTLLKLSNLPALQTLYCNGNQLTQLDVKELSTLKKLLCNDNQLTQLDVAGLPELQTLNCSNNQLTQLDIAGLPKLYTLLCNNNQLTQLDVAGAPILSELDCNYNQLTSLNLQNEWLNESNCHIGGSNVYSITVSDDRTFDLHTLPGSFDPSKASDWKGGTVNGSILTVDEGATKVVYSYDCGNGVTGIFSLQVLTRIKQVNLRVNTPKKNEMPDGTVVILDNGADVCDAKIRWGMGDIGGEPIPGSFRPGKEYTLQVGLYAKPGYKFSEETVCTVNGRETKFIWTQNDDTEYYAIKSYVVPLTPGGFEHDHKMEMTHDEHSHWMECPICHTVQDTEAHVYDDDKDTTCNVCGYVRSLTPGGTPGGDNPGGGSTPGGTTPGGSTGGGDGGGAIVIVAAAGAVAAGVVGYGVYNYVSGQKLQALLPEGVAAPENRAQTALLLWNTAGRPEPADAPAFADVADPDTAKAAQWCVEQGLMKRRLNGKFAPGSSIPAYQVLNAYRKLAGG